MSIFTYSRWINVYVVIIITASIISGLFPSYECCSLEDNSPLLPQHTLLSHGEIVKHPAQPTTLSCKIICPGDLTGCNLGHNWIAMIKEDNYDIHYLSSSSRSGTNGLRTVILRNNYHVLTYNISQLNDSLCASGETGVTFFIDITYINPQIEEVLIFCGLKRKQRTAAYSYSPIPAVLKQDLPKVVSKQIQESPAVIITEGNSAIVTCERRVTNYTAEVQWMLTGSDLLPNDTLLISSDEVLLFKNEMTLEVILQYGDVYEYNNNLFQNFSIIFTNITNLLTGLTVWCGEWWAEGNISQFYEHAAVIAVTPPPPEDESVMIFSHQSRNLTTTERDHVTIICSKSISTFVEWEFLLSNGTRYLYTQNKTMLENTLEFDFHNPISVRDGFQNFSVTFNANAELNNMKIRCAAKETENSEPVFNSFEDIIVVEKAPGILDGLSDKAVATITTPTVAGTVFVTILVLILIGGIIFMVNKSSIRQVKPHVGLPYSNQDVTNRHEQSYNNSVNERIARDLELTTFEDNTE